MKYKKIDVYDEKDNPLGISATYEEVHSKGLWYRGVHVLIYTPERKIVMQKRSPSLNYHPGEVEISVGGIVDTGEKPEQAAVREVREELGIEVHPASLRFIGKTKFNHSTKTQLNRNFIYSYVVCLPENDISFKIDPNETSSAFLISEKRLRRALKRHRIIYLGKASKTYSYWTFLLDSI